MNWLRVILGAICGVVATGPMTAAMILWHRRLPARERYPLPPHEITGAVLEQSGLDVSPAQVSVATLLAHFGYGGAAGALYGLVPVRRLPPPVGSGMIVGLLVWSLSYFGLMPALRVLRPATEHPVRRSALMLGAHFIWGITLSALHSLLVQDFTRAAPALQQRTLPAADRLRPAVVP